VLHRRQLVAAQANSTAARRSSLFGAAALGDHRLRHYWRRVCADAKPVREHLALPLDGRNVVRQRVGVGRRHSPAIARSARLWTRHGSVIGVMQRGDLRLGALVEGEPGDRQRVGLHIERVIPHRRTNGTDSTGGRRRRAAMASVVKMCV
jgi:hypothetical protein